MTLAYSIWKDLNKNLGDVPFPSPLTFNSEDLLLLKIRENVDSRAVITFSF